MSEMQLFTTKSLHVSFELWGAIFCVIALIGISFAYIESKREKRYLMSLMFAGSLLLVNDATAWYFRGVPGDQANFWVQLSNFMTFLCYDILMALTTVYINYKILKDTKIGLHHWRFNTAMVFITLDIIMLLLSQYFHWYYYVDADNYYHRSYLSFMTPLTTLIVLVMNLAVLIRYRRNLSHRMEICLVLCLLLPMIAAVYQYMHYGISYVNVAMIIALINLFINVIGEQGERLTKNVTKLHDMKIELMISQIGPHFIYNTLSTIKHLCRTNPEQAEKTIDDFSVYLRGNLDSLTENKCIRFETELKHVKAYLAVEQQRFGNRLHVVYDIQDEDFFLPALTLQPIVENAVQHGICAREEGGTVTIQTKLTDNIHKISVIDDGVGFTVSETKTEEHIGIKNIEERLHDMCDGTVDIDSKKDIGTTITISIPEK